MNEDLRLLRKGLWPFSMVYGLATVLRGALFDRGLRAVARVGVPVISVGNLSTGGTGKTPLVIWLVEQAQARNLRPGVLARGYGRRKGDALNDEGKLLARRFPDLCQVQDPDRVRGARRLVDQEKVDLIILDDGFQHRRLHRDRDLVCLDTADPFAGGLLPVGNLREPPSALRRAQGVVLTRAGSFVGEAVDRRMAELATYCGDGVRFFAADHVPTRLVEMPGGREVPLESLRDQKVVLLSGIARPDTFANLVEELGAAILAHHRRRDHHLHTPAELEEVSRESTAQGAVLVTTEKDDVKLGETPLPRWVLELEFRFLGDAPRWEWLLSQ